MFLQAINISVFLTFCILTLRDREKDMTFSCKHCGQELETNDSEAGNKVLCPSCNNQVIPPLGCEVQGRDVLANATLNNTCAICPKCNTKIPASFSTSNNGSSIRCPRCRNLFRADSAQRQFTNRPNYLSKIVGVFLIIFLISLTIYFIYSSKKTRGRSPSVQPTITSTTNQLLAIEDDGGFFTSSDEAKALQKFYDYKALIFKRDYPEAIKAWTTVLDHLKIPATKDSFWRTIYQKEGNFIQLRVVGICASCPVQQKCEACNSDCICRSCQGLKVCQTCKGEKNVITRPCADCVAERCSKCRGIGTCQVCSGYRTAICADCGGMGKETYSDRVVCPKCNGSGKRPGMRRGDGSYIMMGCATCNNKGGAVVNRSIACSTCKSTGRVQCKSCRGTAKCHACSGKGELNQRPESICSTCNGKKVIELLCSGCQNMGLCTSCRGTGICSKCREKLTCAECKDTQEIRLMDIPVPRSWVLRENGCWFSTADDFRKLTLNDYGNVMVPKSDKGISVEGSFTTNGILIVVYPPTLDQIGNLGIFKPANNSPKDQ